MLTDYEPHDVTHFTVGRAAGAVVTLSGSPLTVIGFTVVGGEIAEMDAVAEPALIDVSPLAVVDD